VRARVKPDLVRGPRLQIGHALLDGLTHRRFIERKAKVGRRVAQVRPDPFYVVFVALGNLFAHRFYFSNDLILHRHPFSSARLNCFISGGIFVLTISHTISLSTLS